MTTLNASIDSTYSTNNFVTNPFPFIKTISDSKPKTKVTPLITHENKIDFKTLDQSGKSIYMSRLDRDLSAIPEFAKEIIVNQKPISEEFEKVFKKNMWDLLA